MNLEKRILEIREATLQGRPNYVPFNDLGEFTKVYPGSLRGMVTCLTGTESSSKSAFSRWLLEHSAIPWAINNKKNLKIIRFGLEENTEQYEYSLLSYRLYQRFKVEYNLMDFNSMGRIIPEAHLPYLKQGEEDVNLMKKFVTYESTTFNSYGFWKKVRDFAAKRGKFLKQGKEVSPEDDGWDQYLADDPDEFVIIVVDNLSYVTQQKGEADRREAVWNTVENLRRYAALKLNYIVYIVQHQDATSENQESRKEKSILPTAQGLSINKDLRNSYTGFLGIANPNKINQSGVDLNVRLWDGYDLKVFGSYLRTINILKSRFGMVGNHYTTFFAGRSSFFSSLDKPGTPQLRDFITNELPKFK